MKRWLLRICVFLILGAIANVAVAWGAALAAKVGSQPERYSGDGREGYGDGPKSWSMWLVQRNDSPLLTRFASDYIVNPSGSFVVSDTPASSLVPVWARSQIVLAAESQTLVLFAAGWPMRTFSCRFEEGRYANTIASQDGLRLPNRPLRGTMMNSAIRMPALPLRPIWPGFAINTVFYAVGGWLLFAGPFVVRRWRRIRRGLCPKCAYDLRGAGSGTNPTVCPECGHQVDVHQNRG